MKRNIKRIVLAILALALVWETIFLFDYLNLNDSDDVDQKPMIVLSEERTSDRVVYNSLGYSAHYLLESDGNQVNGIELQLFGKVIWSRIE